MEGLGHDHGLDSVRSTIMLMFFELLRPILRTSISNVFPFDHLDSEVLYHDLGQDGVNHNAYVCWTLKTVPDKFYW